MAQDQLSVSEVVIEQAKTLTQKLKISGRSQNRWRKLPIGPVLHL